MVRSETWGDVGMAQTALLERITVDPAVCGGRPCIRGHRIWVALVFGLLADGLTVADILHEYPGIEEADVQACIAYGRSPPAECRTTRTADGTADNLWR